MSTWSPPHDECRACKFYNRKKPNLRCRFCVVGEFFEEKGSRDTFEMMNRFDEPHETEMSENEAIMQSLHESDKNDE